MFELDFKSEIYVSMLNVVSYIKKNAQCYYYMYCFKLNIQKSMLNWQHNFSQLKAQYLINTCPATPKT